MLNQHIICPLCAGAASLCHQDQRRSYFECSVCKAVFVHPQSLPDAQSEKERYDLHQNNPLDKGYQQYLFPLIEAVLLNQKATHQGLDFGSGPASAVVHLLEEKKYNIQPYDPFYFPEEQLLKQEYDYISCTEVMEHFHQPAKSFKLLHQLLKQRGKLYCMTQLLDEHIPFSTWYYKNDFTHVFFYRPETIYFIVDNFGFRNVHINERLIYFEKYR